MSKVIETREAWHPQTRQDRDAVLRELQEILSSPHFCNSKRYPGLLKYIVENTLVGKSELLKERTLGIEVFDRPPTYDTNTDTVVRYTAGEVRKRLQLYYSETDRSSSIQISLPAGSYIPEFILRGDESEEAGGGSNHPAAHISTEMIAAPALTAGSESHSANGADPGSGSRLGGTRRFGKRFWWLIGASLVVIFLFAGLGWRYYSVQPQSALDAFWAPVLRDQKTVLICTGSSVFTQNSYTGNVVTAGKGIDYSFVSIQAASSIAQISGQLERSGSAALLEPSATTPLSQLREHSVVQLGGYNNQWTMRLLQPLRFYFAPEPDWAIVDRMHPQMRWARDHSLPYSSADDFALVARYRDATTGSWVVVLAGLGRNGTEAAAQFAMSPHYLQMLRDQIGTGFSNRNIEAVLKITVIDGKTGAPSILAVHTW